MLEFLQVTEAGALAAARFMGQGKKDEADQAAVESMRNLLNQMDIEGKIVIGEGERDEAPMLYIGEILGKGEKKVDIAVDPVEGTNLVANGLPNAISVMAVAEKGGLFNAPDTYMEKLAVGPKSKGLVDINAPIHVNLQLVANSLERSISDITAIVLDRPRHAEIIKQIRLTGARIRLISDGDTDAAIATAIDGTGIHILLGIGGAPEGVLAASALKCLGGEFQAKLKPRNEDEKKRCLEMGINNLEKVLYIEDLVKSNKVIFVATGITDGDLLGGVKLFGNGARTYSIIMSSESKTVRFIETVHRFSAKSFFLRRI
ncbi:MAG: class II fructose-bisphosphatase [Armatimonadetes bacterium]|nr:class II fructose-bisphosphatase [Armatimonadota bacterium]